MANFKNKSELAKLVPPSIKGDIWSSVQEGFGIRIGARKKDGTFQREYIARYRDINKKDQRPTIGRYDEVTFEQAAERAYKVVKDAKERVRDAKNGVVRAPTMAEAYEQFVRENRVDWSPVTLNGYDSRWKNLARFYDSPMDQVSAEDWFDLYAENSVTKGPIAALHAHSLARSVYNYLIAEKVIKENPCEDLARQAKKRQMIVKKPARRKRHVPLELLPDYYQALITRTQPAQRDYILFALLTGFRASLLGSLAWSRLDPKLRIYHVEALDIGNKSKIEFNFPICDFLWERVIAPRLQLRKPGEEWIIESPRRPGTPLHSVRGTHAAMFKQIGVLLSDHDLRKTFGSVAYAATRDLLTVQRLLTHSVAPKNRETEVTELYVLTAESTFREAVEAAARQFVMYTNKSTEAMGELPEPTLNYEESARLQYADQAKAEALVVASL